MNNHHRRLKCYKHQHHDYWNYCYYNFNIVPFLPLRGLCLLEPSTWLSHSASSNIETRCHALLGLFSLEGRHPQPELQMNRDEIDFMVPRLDDDNPTFIFFLF